MGTTGVLIWDPCPSGLTRSIDLNSYDGHCQMVSLEVRSSRKAPTSRQDLVKVALEPYLQLPKASSLWVTYNF